MEYTSSIVAAERALDVLDAMADSDGYVASTNRTLATRIGVSAATAQRAISRLIGDGALTVVRRGGRVGPSTFRVLRRADREVLRVVPVVA